MSAGSNCPWCGSERRESLDFYVCDNCGRAEASKVESTPRKMCSIVRETEQLRERVEVLENVAELALRFCNSQTFLEDEELFVALHGAAQSALKGAR